ncbi:MULTISPECIES: NAD(P)-binding protein [Eggerthella]|uniref:NAD(P)-binding protein n=1 Tax=Eggerthella TaxID=84111 RepID=UPI000A3B983C|nr:MULTISPECIES: NAD(P)-binding protein [Eggerthella]MDB1740370.1 NAD(P)-binding protein [Eggerthella lenta]MDB1743319.1 NAD(P)-binding protein [Eggerthella lenta]MDU2821294.1 NAD(P)-binding protein [Eggerthella lenta]MDU5067005.1 NAD(P)-binding protein [Eggerthella sp.]RDB97908.1 FAD-dependent oxidoreductase [Eggerthella lenta]
MDGGPVAKLSIAPRSRDDARIAAHLDTFARRVEATPPGMCPLAVQLTMLQASGAQTCGKCVPCRDGIPQLAAMLKRVVDCDADEGVLEGLRALAEMIRDTSDCAIGYEAARSVLEGLDTFADEYASHLRDRSCQEGVGQTVPCETLCPAHVDVPAYIALTAAGDYAGAVNMVRKDNPFPTACAFVCEHPCETRCRRTLIDAPINIRGIKKFAVDQMPADQVAPPPRSVDTARTVAVIGGGPSGLTCAYFLALMGHRVTVFEERAQLGGMLRYGIPAYRFPRERLDEDIRGILNAGTITARCGEAVGAHEMAEIADTYHAVYVSIGAQTGKSLRIDGVDAEGVVSAVDLLGAIGDGDYPDFTGKRVVVVGGGNVAMDCARTSVRAGADEVSVVYRRRKDDMTALPAEVESAIAEGVEMIVLEAPVSIEADERGHCTALITQPQMIGPVRGGRPAPVAADKPTRRIEADVILIAVGQNVVSGPFEEFGMQTTWGCFNADEHLAAEGHDHVFVGGDCQIGPSTVIRAIGAGKVAARNIDEFLGYHHKLPCDVEVPEPLPNDRTPKGRVEITERPARERRLDFDGVENGMSREEVVQECGRCLRCDRFGCGVMEGGRHQYA